MAESSNILLNPVPELVEALRTNSWGITTSAIVIQDCFPITADDIEAVRKESSKLGRTNGRVVAKATVLSLEGVDMVIVLDQRGFTLESAMTRDEKTYPQQTFETLETLLIATSPAYVEAMTREVSKRFEGLNETRLSSARDEKEEEMAEGGEKEVWL